MRQYASLRLLLVESESSSFHCKLFYQKSRDTCISHVHLKGNMGKKFEIALFVDLCFTQLKRGSEVGVAICKLKTK